MLPMKKSSHESALRVKQHFLRVLIKRFLFVSSYIAARCHRFTMSIFRDLQSYFEQTEEMLEEMFREMEEYWSRSPFAVGTVNPTAAEVRSPPGATPRRSGRAVRRSRSVRWRWSPVAGTPRHLGNGRPVVTTEPGTGRRRLELVLELGRPYTAEEVVVRVNGRRLNVEV